MKKNNKIPQNKAGLRIAILLLMLSPVMVAMAQTTYKLAVAETNSVKILGTSNVHDWTMESKEIETYGAFKFNSRDEMVDVTTLKFSVQAKRLKSGKTSMDNRTYKTLKADEFPTISYQLTSATVTIVQNNKYQILTKGTVTIAGKSQPIEMKVSAFVNADHTITCHGTEDILLTDYGIAPPSFLLGAMKVGNALTIQFNLTYTK